MATAQTVDVAGSKAPGAGTEEEPSVVLLDLKQASERSQLSIATLNRYIASGRLNAVKLRGKNMISEADLEAAVGPIPVMPKTAATSEDAMRAWAQRVAAATPPMTDDQRKIVVAMFSDALRDQKA